MIYQHFIHFRSFIPLVIPFTYKPTWSVGFNLLIMNTLIEKLNSLEIIQKYDWIESIPSDIYNEYFD